MPGGFVPDTGKARAKDIKGNYLIQFIAPKFWLDPVSIHTIYTTHFCNDDKEEEVNQTEPTTEINTVFFNETFDQLPPEAKELMDITTLLDSDFTGVREKFRSPGYYEVGSISHEFKQYIGGRCGSIKLLYHWSAGGEDIIYEESYEKYIIPSVIHHNHKYYALTREFIDWCMTPDKPKRARWLSKLTYNS